MSTNPSCVMTGKFEAKAALYPAQSDVPATIPSGSTVGMIAGFYFSFRAILALVTARWIGVGSEPGVVAGLLFGYLLFLTIGMVDLDFVKTRPGGTICWKSFRWVVLFLVYSGCSLVWSATVSVPASLVYWSAMAVDVAVVLLLLRTRNVSEVSHSLMKGFIQSCCLLALLAWAMPPEADIRLGDLEFFNTNQIANLCALGIFFAQFLMARRDGRWRFVICLLALTLLRSLSKATLVAFVVSQIVLLFRNDWIDRRKKIWIAAAALWGLLVFWGLIEAYYDNYTTEGNKAETLTGRTAIWAFTLNAAVEKPWTGNGIDSMWKVFPPFGNELFEARHAENEMLQQFYSYGVAGIAMLVGLYGSLYRRIRSMPRDPARAVLLSLMLFVVIRGLAEAEPIDLLLPLWMITLIGAIAGSSNSPQRELFPSIVG